MSFPQVEPRAGAGRERGGRVTPGFSSTSAPPLVAVVAARQVLSWVTSYPPTVFRPMPGPPHGFRSRREAVR